MAKMISCRDAGVNCDFEARAETVEELMEKVKSHARTAHGMAEMPPELAAKARTLIKDV